jgi:hypothetical protein
MQSTPKTKDQIITELFKSGKIHEKVSGICFRNGIKKDTKIEEDIVSETFFHLSKKKETDLQEMYEDNPDRIVGLAVRIAIRKGVLTHSQYPSYPKHSLAKFILFTSNLNQTSSLSPSETIEDDYGVLNDSQIILTDTSHEEDPEVELWKLIRGNLTEEENDFLDKLLNQKKGRGRYKMEILEKMIALKERIKQIVTENNIKL